MKIIHTSDIRIGAGFAGLKQSGDRLRAGLKETLSKIINYASNEKTDFLIIAGNLLDNLDVSNNLLDYIAGEISRISDINVIIQPGARDHYSENVFWKSWNSLRSLKNVHIFDNPRIQHFKFENLDCTIYGIPPESGKKQKSSNLASLTQQETKYHIGVLACPSDDPAVLIDRIPIKFDYVALGGSISYKDLSDTGLRAVISGAPEQLDFDQPEAGNIVKVEILTRGQPIIERTKIGNFEWQFIEYNTRDILSNDDLVEKLRPLAKQNVFLRVQLTGLALFESLLIEPEYVLNLLKDDFLFLDIIDKMKVLPENISEVKISEKAILGQYIKLMAKELNDCDENKKPQLEKSLKIGYALLQGRELW